jgi:hypothetical protein
MVIRVNHLLKYIMSTIKGQGNATADINTEIFTDMVMEQAMNDKVDIATK